MYNPSHFNETDVNEIRSVVENFPLAMCVCSIENDFIINHFPVIWEGDMLIGHIAKANDLHIRAQVGERAVFVFTAQNSYISPNWYPSKPETHRHVPTWNYQVVHIHGRLFFDESRKAKVSAVGKLTKLHEEKRFGAAGWKMRDAPKDYMDSMIENIVAFKFEISKIEAKSKLSQNREKRDFDNVVAVMEENNLHDLARRMKSY